MNYPDTHTHIQAVDKTVKFSTVNQFIKAFERQTSIQARRVDRIQHSNGSLHISSIWIRSFHSSSLLCTVLPHKSPSPWQMDIKLVSKRIFLYIFFLLFAEY